ILTNRLNLPPLIATLVIVLLSIGFPVVAILAWIFDLTPEGIKKTESIEELAAKAIVTTPERRRLKASDIAIAVLAIAVIILAWPKIFKGDTLENLRAKGSTSVAVMPFQNVTNDTTLNFLKDAIQMSLISTLSNTKELKVRRQESVNSLLQSKGVTVYASITPALAGSISKKLDADIYITGNIQKAGSETRLNAQLTDTRTNDVLKSFEINANEKEVKFSIIDSLRKKITDFLLISKIIKESAGSWNIPALTTNSPEALRYFFYGQSATDTKTAIDWYLKAVAADSNFYWPMYCLSFTYPWIGEQEQGLNWFLKCYKKKDQWPVAIQIAIMSDYATNFESLDEQIKYFKQYEQIDDQNPNFYHGLGLTYMELKEYDKAIPALEKSLVIARRWGKEYLGSQVNWFFGALGNAYHYTGQYRKEKKLYRKADRYYPDDTWISNNRAVSCLEVNDTAKANLYIEKYRSVKKEKYSASEADIATGVGEIYQNAKMFDKAEQYFRKSLALEPENPARMLYLAEFLNYNNRNLNEVSDLMNHAMKLAASKTDYYNYLNAKGWSLYKQGKNKEALEILQKCWDEAPFKLYSIRSHLEEVKKAVTGQR
ncbi:MAG: tetratricopeptide repeat protein, partial [Bacteroidota bacterium]|nr:tetratricopeptide repeat protein [Bacteroidota bacterium]